jgi:hypothetical protein
MINESDETRVSLSFNTFYQGEIHTDGDGWLSSLWIDNVLSGTSRTNNSANTMSSLLASK